MSDGKKSLKEKLRKRRAELKKRQSGSVFFPKEGTTRFRVLNTGDEDWAQEMKYFYLGNEIKGIYSPATFDKPCPVHELYVELKESKKDGDKEKAKMLVPKKKFLVPVMIYEDEKGKKVDEGNSNRLMQVPARVYTAMLDYFLDPDYTEFNDPKDGWDFKLKREGTTLTNTTYNIMPVPHTELPDKKWEAQVDVEKMAKDIIENYEDLETKLAEYMAGELDDEPKTAKEESTGKKKKKKKRQGDQ